MNPNDPEENPEAFMYLERKRVDSERKERLRSLDMNPNDPEQNPEAFLGLGRCVNQHSIGVDKKNASNQQQRRETHRSSNSGSTSEKSNSYSENSTMQPNHRRARSDQKRSSRESVGSVRTGNSHSDESVSVLSRLFSGKFPYPGNLLHLELYSLLLRTQSFSYCFLYCFQLRSTDTFNAMPCLSDTSRTPFNSVL